jgi:hypothetical protein
MKERKHAKNAVARIQLKHTELLLHYGAVNTTDGSYEILLSQSLSKTSQNVSTRSTQACVLFFVFQKTYSYFVLLQGNKASTFICCQMTSFFF